MDEKKPSSKMDNYGLSADYKGGWETYREKRLKDLELTPEERLEVLEEMMEFNWMVRESARVVR